MIAETLRFTTNLMKGRGRTPSKDQSDTIDSVIASIITKELHYERHKQSAMDMSNECCLMRQNWPTQKSVDSLSLGFIGIVIVSPPGERFRPTWI